MKTRLDKLISQCAGVSRTQAAALCRAGKVSVDGAVIKSGAFQADLQEQELLLNGKPLTAPPEFLYIMLNKPQGVVCSTQDGLSPTVLSLLPEEYRRRELFPAGRLDKDTEGFVLITDDGALAHKMLSPKSHVPKEYEVLLKEPVREEYAAVFASGMEISVGERCLPAELFFNKDNPFACRVVLHEGKYHQVKRMFAAVGNSVVFLKRIRIGGLCLEPNLAVGAHLVLLHKDVEKLLTRKGF